MRGQALLAAGALALTAFTAVPATSFAQSYQAPYAANQGAANQGYDPNCGQRKTKNAILGGLLGATIGAVVGSQMGSAGHRGDVGLVGGAVGAAAGAGIGASGTNCAAAARYPAPPPVATGPGPAPYANNAPPPQPYGYGRDDEDDLLGGPDSRQPVYRDNDRYSDNRDNRDYRDDRYRGDRRYADNRYRECRWGEEIVRDRYGSHREPVQTCRDPRSGQWVVVR